MKRTTQIHKSSSSNVHDIQNHAYHKCGRASSFPQPLRKPAQRFHLCLPSASSRVISDLKYPPQKRKRTRSLRAGMLVCARSVYYHLLKAAWRLHLKCSKKLTKKSRLAKLSISQSLLSNQRACNTRWLSWSRCCYYMSCIIGRWRTKILNDVKCFRGL